MRDADFELDLESISFPNFDPEQVTKAFTDVHDGPFGKDPEAPGKRSDFHRFGGRQFR